MADPRTHLYANNASCRLAEDLTAGETSIQLETGKGALFPNPSTGEIFIVTLENLVTGVREIMFCTDRVNDVLEVERGQEGTDAVEWTNGPNVLLQNRATAGTFEHLEEQTGGGGGSSPIIIQLACSDLTTNIIAGTRRAYVRSPASFTIAEVRASLLDDALYDPVVIDINKNGSTILSTKLTIDEGELTSLTAATPVVISDTDVNDDDELVVDIDSIGEFAKGLIVTIIGE